MMNNYAHLVKINHNPNWPYISYHSYRILIIGGSGLGKTNVLLNLIQHQQSDIDKFYLYVKDPFKSKYQFLINGREKVEFKTLKNLKALIDYSQIIEDDNPTKKRRMLILFDDMIADMESYKKLNPKVTELF